MTETIKLYDRDAYSMDFEAEVVSCKEETKEGATTYQIVLDQTLFFPEEGGQSPDLGTIEKIAVVDVQIKGGIITHTTEAPLSIGQKVQGHVDWQHRFSNMQQHSGEHIFSGLVHNAYGYNNVGFHLSDQVVTMDFDGVLTTEQAAQIEKKANEVIVRNLPIEVTYPSKEELSQLDYRSKIEIEGQVRIITIPGVDVCACCAPHVRLTGEIGILKIVSLQSYKGGVRISILCGFRALADYRQRLHVISQLSNLLSSNQEALVENVTKLKDGSQALRQELNLAKQEYMQLKAAQIPAEQADVLLFEQDVDAATMRITVNMLVEKHSGICGVFAGSDSEGYRFIIGSKNVDVRATMEVLKKECNARGGGSASMIQGSVSADEISIKALLQNVPV